MYQNQLIFNAVFSKGQIYTGSKPDGDVYQKQAEISIGYIQGDKREIRAGMTDNVLESDNWLLFNVLDADNIYHESVAILGVASVDEGAYYTQRYFAETLGANMQSVFVGEYPVKVLKRFLDSATAIQNVRIKPEAVERFYNVLITETPVWDDDVLLSHSGSVRALVADMVANDDNNELLDTMDKLNFAQFIQDFDQLDALFTDVTGLSKLARQLTIAIDKKGTDKVSLDRITQSEKPFKRNGMTNLALNLSMTDGQTVTILFYNPDNTPSKLLPNDILTSWKWVLNNRDVTAVLQPETGKDVNIPALASRIMQLVEKNHNRFVRNKAKLEKENAKLADLTETVTQKENIIAELDKEIAEWQAKVDELLKNPVVKEESNDNSETAQESEQNEAIAQNEQATDEPIVLTGNEFGEFDLTSEGGVKALRENAVNYLNKLAKTGEVVYCPALNADVKFGRKNNRKFGSLGSNPIKLFMASQIKSIIAGGKIFKPSQERYDDTPQKNKMTYHYLKTAVIYQGQEYGARIVVRQDSNGNYHYDLQVNNGGVDAIMDSLNPDNEKAELLLATSQGLFGFSEHSTGFNNRIQDGFDGDDLDDDVMLDSLKSGYVLNLFIFDKDGNEIKDEPTDNQETTTDNQAGEPQILGATLEWTEANFDENLKFDSLEALQAWFNKTYTKEFFKEDGSPYFKNKLTIDFNSDDSVTMRIDVNSRTNDLKGDYNPLKFSLAEWLEANYQSFSKRGLVKANQGINTEQTDPNLAYLTDMANGKIELTVQNMKEHILKLKEIAVALDGKHDDLLNQAIEVYQQFALSVKVQ